MGAKGARCSMGTKGERRKILSTLHPNTILKPNPDPNTHLNPQPSPNGTPAPTGTELVGEGTLSRRLQRRMRYALESG